jgi:hypothetical protein
MLFQCQPATARKIKNKCDTGTLGEDSMKELCWSTNNVDPGFLGSVSCKKRVAQRD